MEPAYSLPRVIRFFVPLALQAMSQCLTYPLIAAIVSADGATGFMQLAALAQGHNTMFLLGALGFGLVTTGMIFARDRVGAQQFRRVNFTLAAIVVALHVLVSLPPIARLVFQQLMGLTPDMAEITRKTLLISAIPQFFFFCRNVPLVQLLNARKSAEANFATLTRLALTLSLIPLCIRLHLTGWLWGNIAFAIPVGIEWALTQWLAREPTRSLPQGTGTSGTALEQLLFTLPVSLGGVFITGSALIVSSFIARTPDMKIMLAVHTVAVGILSPVCMAAIRFQAVTIAFPPRDEKDFRLMRCALLIGGILSLIPLAFATFTPLSRWYFLTVQNLPPTAAPMAKWAVLLVCLLPPVQALRGHAEGLAALQKRPAVILCGQSVYLAALATTCHIELNLGVRGCVLGVIAIFFGQLMAFATIRISLWTTAQEQRQAPHEPNHLHC